MNFTEKNNELKLNIKTLLRLQLALENYEDNNHSNNHLLKEANLELGNFRKNRANISIDEQIDLSAEIIRKYNKVLDEIGRENFIFYEDGDINYIWKEN